MPPEATSWTASLRSQPPTGPLPSRHYARAGLALCPHAPSCAVTRQPVPSAPRCRGRAASQRTAAWQRQRCQDTPGAPRHGLRPRGAARDHWGARAACVPPAVQLPCLGCVECNGTGTGTSDDACVALLTRVSAGLPGGHCVWHYLCRGGGALLRTAHDCRSEPVPPKHCSRSEAAGTTRRGVVLPACALRRTPWRLGGERPEAEEARGGEIGEFDAGFERDHGS